MSSSIEKYKTKPYAHQLKCLLEYGKKEYFALLADMGTGKAQPIDCKVMTPTGWRLIGDLNVGDKLFAADGSVTDVIGVYPQGEKEVFEIRFGDGSSTRSCKEHLWLTASRAERQKFSRGLSPYYASIKTLEQIMEKTHDAAGNAIHQIPVAGCLEFEEKETPVDPYTLGVLIGDGCLRGGVTFTNKEEFIVEKIKRALPQGAKISSRENNHAIIGNPIYKNAIKEIGLYGKYSFEKFIPDIYKFNNKEIRIAILQGLIDTDGTIEDGQAIFSTSSKMLADDVADISRSLGGIARIKKRTNCGYFKNGIKTLCRDGYSVRLNMPKEIIPCSLPRKKDLYKPTEKYFPTQRTIKEILPAESRESVCISIAHPSRLYITDDHIVTHNTWIIINNIAELWADEEVNGVLVLAPNGVQTNWANIELGRHMPDWVRYKASVWKSNPKKKDVASVELLFNSTDATELRIFMMNWEALQSEKGFEAAKRFCVGCSKLMIVGDETTMIKNPSAVRTKALMKLKKYSSYRRIMNGTLISNSPFDAFSQMSFLDEHILGTTSYYAFKAEYAEMLQEGHGLLTAIKQRTGGKFTPQIVAKGRDGRPAYKNLDKLEALISKHSFRVLKKDCLDLPKKIYKTVFYEMLPAQRKAYDLMKEESRMMLLDEAVPVANKLVALGKLAQICSGYFIPPGQSEPIRVVERSPKIDLLVETAERVVLEQGRKMIIWARYHVELDDIAIAMKSAGISFVQYDGRVKTDDRETAKVEFQEGEAQVFIGQQQSGGVGITLTAASCVVYFSNTFSLYNRLQSEDRAHRIGQEEDVVYIDLVAENSIEQKTLAVLRSKKSVADMITGDKVLDLL